MTAPLRRLARVAHVPRAVHRVPFAVRGKATAYVARSAGTLSSRDEYTQNRQIDDTTSHHLLPFYATMVGRVLSTALSETQRLAFAGRFLSSPGTSRRAVSQTEHTTDAAITAARKERDAAVSRANLNEANALTLRLRLAQSDHAAVETLRGELKDAQAEAADMRIALNALKFARQDTRVVETRSDWSSVLEISPRESELKTAIAALSAELDDAKQRVLNAEAASANFASSLVMDVRTKNRELTNAANADAAFSQTERHPIFGHLLKDFGFKKVFAMKAGVLADKKLVKVYEQQRAFRSARAVTIAEMKTEDRFAVPGVISLAEGTAAVKTSGPAGATKSAFSEIFAAPTRSVSILDGQHRVGALAILLEKGVIRDTDEVLVEVFPNVCDTKASDLFTEINQSEPVRFLDLPGAVAPVLKRSLELSVQFFLTKYPTMFSNSPRCRVPHVNLDVLRETMHEADVASRFGLKNENDFIQWMQRENETFAARTEKQWVKARPKVGKGAAGTNAAYVKALGKATDSGFFLGMSDTWLETKEGGK